MSLIFNIAGKIKKKAASIVARHIPYNLSYKPVGYYPKLQDYVAATGAACEELYPQETSELIVPAELLNAQQRLTEVPRTGTAPAASITEIKNGRLYTDGVQFASVIAGDNKLIGDISLQNGNTDVAGHQLLRQKCFSEPLKLNGTAFHTLIGGSGENNYFHWLFDSLPRLHLLQKAGWLDRVDWFVVPRNRLPYQKDTLRKLGIPATKIVEGHILKHIQADTLLATTFVRHIEHIPYWACQFLRDSFMEKPLKHIMPKRIYISREDSSTRVVQNEASVTAMLKKYGFSMVQLSKLSFTEQVSLFASAEVVVAPHGAGLANLVFCKPGTQVIELFAKEYTLTLYADLAHKVGANYNYLISYTYPVARSLRKAMHKSINISLDALEAKVQEALGLTPLLVPADLLREKVCL